MGITIDAAEFMDTTYGFAVSVTVDGVACSAIFDNANADTFGIVANTQPTLLLASDAAPLAAVGDAVSVAGTSYTIAEIQPDGTGMTRLLLK